MARRYVRDNRGRFASVGATARGGRLKTAAGNKRATQTIQAGSRAGVIGKPAGLKPGAIKPKAAPAPAPAPKAPKRLRFERAYHGTTPATAAAIKKSGFVPSKDGAQGPGVYITTGRRDAQVYANLAAAAKRGDRNSTITEGTAIVKLRVPINTNRVVQGRGLSTSRDDVQNAIKQGKAGRLSLSGGRSDIIGPASVINRWAVRQPTIPKVKSKRAQFEEYIRTGQRPKPLRITRTRPKSR